MKAPPPMVFVVDDDRSVRTSLANLLSAEDYAVETFARAEDYLARAPYEGPACLVLDVRMPGLDGLALQQQLSAEGRSEHIVFITGHGDIPTGVRAMKNGAVDFLPKPFSDFALLEAVAQALARSATARQASESREEMRARVALLTPREFEVFRLVITGRLNKQIADELGAALRTIKRHRGIVMQKLGVTSVADLTRLAQHAGVEPGPGPKRP